MNWRCYPLISSNSYTLSLQVNIVLLHFVYPKQLLFLQQSKQNLPCYPQHPPGLLPFINNLRPLFPLLPSAPSFQYTLPLFSPILIIFQMLHLVPFNYFSPYHCTCATQVTHFYRWFVHQPTVFSNFFVSFVFVVRYRLTSFVEGVASCAYSVVLHQ